MSLEELNKLKKEYNSLKDHLQFVSDVEKSRGINNYYRSLEQKARQLELKINNAKIEPKQNIA